MRDVVSKPLAIVVAGILLMLAIWWAVHALTARPKAEARLGRNTTGAAIESGKDAVRTVGARGAAESDLDKEVGNATRNIENAPDGAAADAAGRDGLCRIAGDRFCEHPVH